MKQGHQIAERSRSRVKRSAIKPVRFRIFPERRTLYAAVNVWPSQKAMRDYARRTGDVRSAARSCHGYCACYIIRSYRPKQRMRTRPMFAEVNLYASALTMRIVTHELFHATVQYGRRIRFDFARLNADDSINADEERLTYAHGELCRQFMLRATALGLYPQ